MIYLALLFTFQVYKSELRSLNFEALKLSSFQVLVLANFWMKRWSLTPLEVFFTCADWRNKLNINLTNKKTNEKTQEEDKTTMKKSRTKSREAPKRKEENKIPLGWVLLPRHHQRIFSQDEGSFSISISILKGRCYQRHFSSLHTPNLNLALL